MVTTIAPGTRIRIWNLSDIGCGRYITQQQLHEYRPLICATAAYMAEEQWHTWIHEIIVSPSRHVDHVGRQIPMLRVSIYNIESDTDDMIQLAYGLDMLRRTNCENVMVDHVCGLNKPTDGSYMHYGCTGVIW